MQDKQKTKFDDGTWKHELRKISDLIPNPKNPRIITDKSLKGLRKSLKDLGYTHRIVIDQNNKILSGHARWLVINHDDPQAVIECLVAQRELTPEEENKSIIGHNVLGGEWNFEELQMHFDPIMLEDFGLEFDLSGKEEDVDVVEDTPPEPEEENKSVIGDVWILGNHRVMCGDSTNPEHVSKLVQGKEVDMLLTDPPYNVDYKSADGKKIQNDHMEENQFIEFLTKVFQNANDVMKQGAPFYIWYADSKGYMFQSATKAVKWEIRQGLVWNKNSFVLSRQDYHWKHEPCLYGWKDGAAHYFINDRTQSTVIEDSAEYNKMTKTELIQIIKQFTGPKEPVTVIDELKPAVNGDHPTMKPVKLMARLVKNSSKINDIVMDLFGGSGSTLIACEQLNRKCCAMELDTKYCDVIVKRWEKFTGKQAYRESDGGLFTE